MTRHLFRATVGLVIGLSAAAAADEPGSSGPPKPTAADRKGPDFSGYATVTTVTGEVVRADDSKVTLRIFWQHAVQKSGGGNGGRGRRPSLHGNHGRGHHSPYAVRRPNVQLKWEHHDYDLPFVPEGMVRARTLPPKTDPNGKKGFYSANEQDELKLPYSAPGYQAFKGDLTPGTVVEAYIVRDKLIPANKVTDADMRIKYAVIVGHDQNVAKNLADVSKSPPKKKN